MDACERCHGTGVLHRQGSGNHGLTLPCPDCLIDEHDYADYGDCFKDRGNPVEGAHPYGDGLIGRITALEDQVKAAEVNKNTLRSLVYNLQLGGGRLATALRQIANGCDNPKTVALAALNLKAPWLAPDEAVASAREIIVQIEPDFRHPPSTDSIERRIECAREWLADYTKGME